LDANGLPSAAVRTEPDRLLVVSTGTTVVGAGGVERYGSNGLLRSVVVEASHRERGCGTALVDALEARARTNGVTTLYLLTTTAAAFFHRLGYAEVARTHALERVRQTTEFTNRCPTSATCLRKDLGDEAPAGSFRRSPPPSGSDEA
jgi:amino-acid N-acetyltransferase